MRRRLALLLAVSALALGFSFAPSGTQEAQAGFPFPDHIGCTLWLWRLLQAEAANDWVTYNQLWAEYSPYCSP